MRYKLLIVVAVALAVVAALALLRLGGSANKGGVTEPNRSQQSGGIVLSCPFRMEACSSKGLFPPTSRPQGSGKRFHWVAASS